MSVGKKQTIVTGGAGLIGRALITALNTRDEDNILIADRLGAGSKWQNLQGLRFDDFVDLDDFRLRVREHGLPQTVTVFHLSGGDAPAGTDADTLVDQNYRLARELCEACLKSGARFIYASSADTYGSGELGHFDNEGMLSTLQPLTAAAFSRHMFDLWAARSGALAKVTGLKFFDVYGSAETHLENGGSLAHLILSEIRTRGTATLFQSHRDDFPDGGQQRDFIHVTDAAAMTLFCYDKPELFGLFNCGTGRTRTCLDVAQAAFTALGRKPDIRFVPLPADQRDTFQYSTQADITKIRMAGFDHDFLSLEAGVCATLGVSAPALKPKPVTA